MFCPGYLSSWLFRGRDSISYHPLGLPQLSPLIFELSGVKPPWSQKFAKLNPTGFQSQTLGALFSQCESPCLGYLVEVWFSCFSVLPFLVNLTRVWYPSVSLPFLPIWVYLVWGSLCFLEMDVCFLLQIKKVFNNYFFTFLLLFLSPHSGIQIIQICPIYPLSHPYF